MSAPPSINRWPVALERQYAARLARRQQVLEALVRERLADVAPEAVPDVLERMRTLLPLAMPLTASSFDALGRSVDAMVDAAIADAILEATNAKAPPAAPEYEAPVVTPAPLEAVEPEEDDGSTLLRLAALALLVAPVAVPRRSTVTLTPAAVPLPTSWVPPVVAPYSAPAVSSGLGDPMSLVSIQAAREAQPESLVSIHRTVSGPSGGALALGQGPDTAWGSEQSHADWAMRQAALVHLVEDDVLRKAAEAARQALVPASPVAPAPASPMVPMVPVVPVVPTTGDPRAAAVEQVRRLSARFALLARNELGPRVAASMMAAAKARGLSRYRWVTQRDERVRPLHRQLDGTVRTWGDPHPTEGHPGDAWGCRCWADPIR